MRWNNKASIKVGAFLGLFLQCIHTKKKEKREKKRTYRHIYYEHDSEFTQLLHPGQQGHPNSPAQPDMAINKHQLCKYLRTHLSWQEIKEKKKSRHIIKHSSTLTRQSIQVFLKPASSWISLYYFLFYV